MNQILNMVVRMVMRTLMRKGVGMAMGAGTKAWRNRKNRKAGPQQEASIDQDPSITTRRTLREDERKGDDILYPTDDFTEDMQPRR